MTFSTPSFEWPLRHRRQLLAAALCGCAMLPACASQPPAPRSGPTPQPAGAAAQAITVITLERDCSGCRTGSRLALHRDGSAVATVTGKARLGTQDSVSHGSLPAADFEALASAVVTSGFFSMAETYEQPGLQDGAWVTLTVARGAEHKQVFRRDEAGPAALKALEADILTLQARLRFMPQTR